MRKKRITLNNAGMVEPPKEKHVIISEFSTVCVGCVYQYYPNECSIYKCIHRPKLTEKKYDSN